MSEAGLGIVVGVADLAVSRAGQGEIVTYALGSCVGVTAYDPLRKVGGLLHFMLAQPIGPSEPSQDRPCMYASAGLQLLLRKVVEAGAEQSRLVLCAAGGAEILEGAVATKIGPRNRTMLRKILWKVGLPIAAEHTGGNVARTLRLDLATGTVRVRSQDGEEVLWAPSCMPSLQP